MSEKDQGRKNSKGISPSLKSGEEPTELLLQLVWSPVETLRERGLAKIFVGNGSVAIVLKNTGINPLAGLVPTLPIETVGTTEEMPTQE